MDDYPHAYYATRKGVPLGQRADLLHCDLCGQGPNAKIHDVSNEENGEALLAAIEGGDRG